MYQVLFSIKEENCITDLNIFLWNFFSKENNKKSLSFQSQIFPQMSTRSSREDELGTVAKAVNLRKFLWVPVKIQKHNITDVLKVPEKLYWKSQNKSTTY